MLKTLGRATWAGVVAPQFLEQFFVAMHDTQTTFNFCFGWIPFAAFTDDLKSNLVPRVAAVP